MGRATRGTVYLAVSLLAFLSLIMCLFLRVGNFKFSENQGLKVEGWMTLFNACVFLERPGDARGRDTLQREMCTATEEFDCVSEARTYIAAQSFAVWSVVSIVPSMVLAGLDTLGKAPTVACLGPKHLLVLTAVINGLFEAIELVLLLNLVHYDFCHTSAVGRLEGFDQGAVIYLTATAIVLAIVCAVVALAVEGPPPKKDSPQANQADRSGTVAGRNMGEDGAPPKVSRKRHHAPPSFPAVDHEDTPARSREPRSRSAGVQRA